jgi:two-component sensor histidine kinase
MKIGHLLKKIIYSSFFLAGFPAIIIIFFLPPLATKSRLIVEPVEKNLSINVFEDLNSDSISEIVRTGKAIPYYFILVLDNDMHVYDQWNLPDSIDMDMSDFFFGNFDHDRYKEIYIFTFKNDSLFLNINEFFDPGGIKSDHLFIIKIRVINKKITSVVYPAGFFDMNGDGKDELFFSIQTGFGVEPRRLYSYDIANRELKSNELTGVSCQFPKMVDSDGDGRPEIFGLVCASGNSKTWYHFSDWSSWLMIYNDSLKFKFPPVEFPGITSRLETEAYIKGEIKGYVISYTTGSADSSLLEPRIMVYSLEGKKIRERLFSDMGLKRDTRLVVLNNGSIDRIYLLASNIIIELNDKLEIINRVNSPFNSWYNSYKEDVDFDGEDELFLYSPDDEKLVIYNENLRKLAEARIKGTEQIFRFSHYSSRDHQNKMFVNAGGGYGYFLKLKANTYYYMGYLAYPGIYFLFFFFIVLIKRMNTLQVVQKENLKQRLVTLQLQGIKAQLDPHFTFNTLNSIASLIYLEERQAAYDYMIKFTELLRGMLNDAERIYRSLGEELEFLTTYLDLEKLRFGEKLKYEIEIGDKVSQKEQVPKLVLQTFAENAIKHGIMPKKDGGSLKISIEKENDYLKLTVEDDGIGREAAAGHSTSTGRGLKITGEFYDILNQINKKPIKHKITDLYSDTNQAAGTRVEVWVPLVEVQGKNKK